MYIVFVLLPSRLKSRLYVVVTCVFHLVRVIDKFDLNTYWEETMEVYWVCVARFW